MKRRLQNLALALISMCALLPPVGFSCSAFAESLPRPSASSDPALLRRWVAVVDKKIEKNGPEAEYYCSKGQLLEWLHEPYAAIQQYSLAIKQNPNDLSFFIGRARSYRAAKKWKEALSDYNTAISRGKVSSESYIGRSLAELALHNYSSAYSDATKAIEIDSSESIAWLAKGNAELELGKLKESVVSLSKAIELEPRDAAFYEIRSAAYAKLGDRKNAKRDMALYEQYSKSVTGE